MTISDRIDPSDLGARLLRLPELVGACGTLPELAALFAETIAPLGMTAAASGMVTGPKSLSAEIFHFVTWPPEWTALYVAEDMVKKDPLPRWAILSGRPAAWSEIVARLPKDDPGHEVVEAAAAMGFTEGYVTPIRSYDGSLGLVSVGGERGALNASDRAFLHSVSCTAFHHAEAISQPRSTAVGAETFSRRERECISLLNQGFTDREIGAILGVAECTARFHIDNARRKVGAKSRSQLVVLAATL